MKLLISLLLIASNAMAADSTIWAPNIPGYITGTQSGGATTTKKNSLDVNIASGVALSATFGATIGNPVPALGQYDAGNKGGILTGMDIGQQTMANSLAVVLASDQSAIPVTATLNSGGTVSLTAGSTVQIASGSNSIGSVTLNTGANTIGSVNQAGSPWGVNMTQVGGSGVTLGQAVAASSIPVVLASNQTVGASVSINPNGTLSARQTVTGSETNLKAPDNAVALILECESVNADNLRWGLSNATTAILSSTLGVLCEPGRSVENITIGQGSYLHMISTGGGSDFIDVQWVLFK